MRRHAVRQQVIGDEETKRVFIRSKTGKPRKCELDMGAGFFAAPPLRGAAGDLFHNTRIDLPAIDRGKQSQETVLISFDSKASIAGSRHCHAGQYGAAAEHQPVVFDRRQRLKRMVPTQRVKSLVKSRHRFREGLCGWVKDRARLNDGFRPENYALGKPFAET